MTHSDPDVQVGPFEILITVRRRVGDDYLAVTKEMDWHSWNSTRAPGWMVAALIERGMMDVDHAINGNGAAPDRP